MTYHALSVRRIVLSLLRPVAVLAAFEVVLRLVSGSAEHSGLNTVAYACYAVVAVLLAVYGVRLYVANRSNWVRVSADGISWRTGGAMAARGATPTGSATLSDVREVRLTDQTETVTSRGREQVVVRYSVNLGLADGRSVVLPIAGMARRKAAPGFHRLLDALRAQPGLPAFDDSDLVLNGS